MFERQMGFAVSHDANGRLMYQCKTCGLSEDGGGVWWERMKAHLSEMHGGVSPELKREDVTHEGELVEVWFVFERPD